MIDENEIEDMLSSVRRLVASEGAASRTVAPAKAPRAPILLLGPSCRVTEVEDPFQMIRALAQEEQDTRDARHLLDARMKEGDAEVWRDIAVTEPGGGVAAQEPEGGVAATEPNALTGLADRLGGDEALRDLIAETVRQELSGKLGERITGSIRKLVRHELLRMLTAEPSD